jgi:FkbM family methyltransferase
MPIKYFKYNRKQISVELNSDADESVFNEIFVERDYKSLEEIISNAKNPIIDIGAHIGLFSIYVRTLNTDVIIFDYEPEENNFKALKENFRLNHLEKNMVAKNLAVGESEGVKTLYVSQDSHNHSLVQSTERSQKVQATTISKILQKAGTVDLVKMDCEGAEFEIIKSMTKEDFGKIKNIYIEYHEYLPELKSAELKKIFEQNGFKTKSSPSHYDKRMGFLFASSQKAA